MLSQQANRPSSLSDPTPRCPCSCYETTTPFPSLAFKQNHNRKLWYTRPILSFGILYYSNDGRGRGECVSVWHQVRLDKGYFVFRGVFPRAKASSFWVFLPTQQIPYSREGQKLMTDDSSFLDFFFFSTLHFHALSPRGVNNKGSGMWLIDVADSKGQHTAHSHGFRDVCMLRIVNTH